MPTEMTPAELADVLASGKYNKAVGSLMVPHNDGDCITEEFCCLGVYAEECGILQRDLDGFGIVKGHGNTWSGSLGGLRPEWMATRTEHYDSGYTTDVEGVLIQLNDNNESWFQVIDYLRGL